MKISHLKLDQAEELIVGSHKGQAVGFAHVAVREDKSESTITGRTSSTPTTATECSNGLVSTQSSCAEKQRGGRPSARP